MDRALEQIARGRKPDGKRVMEGVLSWEEYKKRRATWDKVRQCIGLDAQFWKGAEELLFPPDWLNHAEEVARENRGMRKREAKALGCDPGEGGADTVWTVVDENGIIVQIAKLTADTNVITGDTKAIGRAHNIPPEMWMFDSGGGGQQHVDRLRAEGYPVRTVGFGEAVIATPRRGLATLQERIEQREDRVVYFNRRAQMYGEFSTLLDPSNDRGFGIPAEYDELRRQLAPIPRKYDGEGTLRLPPKRKRHPNSTEVTFMDLIGRSPDHADSLVVAVHCMLHQRSRPVAGAA